MSNDPGDSPILDALPTEPPLDALPADAAPRGYPLIAWLVIALVTGIMVWLNSHPVPGRHRAIQQEGVGQDRQNVAIITLQARFVLGIAEFASRKDDSGALKQLQPFNSGSVDQRLRYAIIAGELGGPAQALQDLNLLDRLLEASPDPDADKNLRHSLARLYDDYLRARFDAPSVSEAEKAGIREQLGWFGRLALSSDGGPNRDERAAIVQEAKKTAVVVIVAFIVFLLALLYGLVALLAFLVAFFMGKLQRGLQTGQSSSGGIYAETFAVWMILSIAFSIAFAELPVGQPIVRAGMAILAGLSALAWPVVRGIPFRQVRQDIGWTGGREPVLEPVIGVLGYPMAYPMLMVGIVLTFCLMIVQSWLAPPAPNGLTPVSTPSHPIVQLLTGGDVGLKIAIFILAAVIAPIVEETMFRGVLLRHLREATHRWGLFLSVASSAIVSSFVFAVIHPQGIVAVPLLMALAMAFCLLREWRGSLIPGIVAHGLNNAAILTVAMLGMGG